METVNIKLNACITTHEGVQEHPFVVVSVNGYPQFSDFCSEDRTIDFDIDLVDDQDYVLSVEYHNKDVKNDVVLGSDGLPELDKRVHIDSIKFDDIELDFFQLVDPSVIIYQPTDPEGSTATGFDATKLSWNGCTTLKFSAPIYMWLLENL